MDLMAGIGALDEGRDADALDVLVAAWRQTRAPELADAVARLSERVTAEARARPSDGAASSRDPWSDPPAEPTAVEVGILLASLYDARGADHVAERLARARRWAADPRVADAALRALEELPFKKSFATHEGSRFYETALALAGDLADRRSPARLSALITRYQREPYNPEHFVKDRLRDALARQRAALEAFAAAPEPLATAMTDVRARLDRRAAADGEAARVGAELLEGIFATPDDDALRSVYADWLTDRGDPRGELIALQLERSRTGKKAPAREKELLELHGKAWLGPLAASVLKQGQRWERGFLAACVFGPKTKEAFAAALGQPAWFLVREIELRTFNRKGDAIALLSPALFRSLRAVRGLREAAVLEIAAAGGLPGIETLGWELERADQRTGKAERTLGELAAFPALRSVELTLGEGRGPEDAGGLVAALSKRVEVRILPG